MADRVTADVAVVAVGVPASAHAVPVKARPAGSAPELTEQAVMRDPLAQTK